jgi:hypothetical protein
LCCHTLIQKPEFVVESINFGEPFQAGFWNYVFEKILRWKMEECTFIHPMLSNFHPTF